MTFKWLTVPESNEEKVVIAVQLWEVRWMSRNGPYNGNTRPELESFATEKLAEDFATSLRQAFQLTKTTSGNKVTVQKES